MDIDLLGSPRFEDGWQTHASSGLDFKTNGEQWYTRQTAWGGDQDWGFRVDYGHRTGNDYRSGDGTRIPSSYKSRHLDVAIGADLDDDTTLEFHYLRLDQTDVEFPGQAFDIDYLVTDTEQEALVLESAQIKTHAPRFNIKLKDDKKYPFICISREPYPRIFPTRDIEDDGSRYLGPYSNVRAMHNSLDLMHKLFPNQVFL